MKSVSHVPECYKFFCSRNVLKSAKSIKFSVVFLSPGASAKFHLLQCILVMQLPQRCVKIAPQCSLPVANTIIHPEYRKSSIFLSCYILIHPSLGLFHLPALYLAPRGH
jgi:hypothetical protein